MVEGGPAIEKARTAGHLGRTIDLNKEKSAMKLSSLGTFVFITLMAAVLPARAATVDEVLTGVH